MLSRPSLRTLGGLAATAGLIALAACGKPKVEADNATPAEVAKAAAGSAPSFQPGRWETTVTMVKMEMPGMPPQAQAMMSHAQKSHTHSACITAEQAAKPDKDFFNSGRSDCVYDHFSLGDGKLDSKMTCKEEGHTMTMEMQGTFAPGEWQAHMVARGSMGGAGEMTSETEVHSKRVGDCNGTEDVKAKS